jgi:serine/threonine-protein kinase
MAGHPHDWQPEDVVAGKYRLVRVIGQGGMGVVFEAYHVRLRQTVAIKMLRSDLALRHNVVVRFEREARAAAQLRSAHAAKVIDVDATPDGDPYIVMEFLSGRNLSQVAADGRPAVHEVVGWVLETCCAIAEAHDLGIVHRDLKPSNLLLAADEDRSFVKVLDFGISKQADENDASLTTTQSTLGTPSYMSPEQVRSAKHVDGRTDIWSLGVILFELLTGTLPFRGATSTAVGAAIVADPVPNMRELRPEVPSELEAVIDKTLSKRAEDRFPDIRSLAAALLPFAKLGRQVSAEVEQMLAGRSRRSSPSEVRADGEAANPPTVPGWSQMTASPARQKRWTISVVALIALAVAGWFAQRRMRWMTAADATGPSVPPSAVATVVPSSSLGASAAPADQEPSVHPRAEPTNSGATEAPAPVRSAAPKPASGKAPAQAKPSAPSPNSPTATPPLPSTNPLHL